MIIRIRDLFLLIVDYKVIETKDKGRLLSNSVLGYKETGR